MRRLLTHLLLIWLAMALPALGQEASPEADPAAPAGSEAGADAAVAEDAEPEAEEDEEPEIDLDDPAFAGLDEQNYEEPEDDFIPTEEIPADQAIPFPTDI